MEAKYLAKRNHTEALLAIAAYLSGPEGQIVLDLPRYEPWFPASRFGSAKTLHAAASFIFVFAFLTVILRVFCRTRTKAGLWWDDWLVILAMGFIVMNQLIINIVDHLGRINWLDLFFDSKSLEMDTSKNNDIILAFKLFVVFHTSYIMAMSSVKFSMLAYYRRRLTTQRDSRPARLYLRAAAAVCVAGMIFSIVSLFRSCAPLSEFWNVDSLTKQKCHRKPMLTRGIGVTAIVTDILIILTPIPLLLKATFSARQKMGIAVLYLLSTLVIIFSILRFVTHMKLPSIQQTIGWSQVETAVALAVANLPMVFKLLTLPLIDTPIIELRPINRRKTFIATENVDEALLKDLPRVPVTELVGTNEERLSHVAYQIQDNNLLHPDHTRRDLQKARRSQMAKSTMLVKEIQSPDYRRIKIVLNGQSWEVRPASVSTSASRPATLYSATSHPTTSRSSVWSSRSSHISATSSRYGGRSNYDGSDAGSDIPEMPPIADEWKYQYKTYR